MAAGNTRGSHKCSRGCLKVGQVGGAEEVDEGDVQLSSALRAYGPAQPACPESFFGAVSRSCPGKTKTVSMALALEAPAVFAVFLKGRGEASPPRPRACVQLGWLGRPFGELKVGRWEGRAFSTSSCPSRASLASWVCWWGGRGPSCASASKKPVWAFKPCHFDSRFFFFLVY